MHHSSHHEQYDAKKVKIINFVSLLLGLGSGLVSYVVSSYFKEVIKNDNIGIFYVAIYIIVFLILINLHKAIKAFGKSITFFVTIFLYAILTFSLIFLDNSLLGASILILATVFYNVSLVEKDVILESYSIDKKTGRTRGWHLIIVSLGFMLGTYLSMQILDSFGYKEVFITQFSVIFIIFIISVLKLRKVNHCFKKTVTIKGIFNKIKNRRNLLRIYYVSLVLEFFYFVMVAYSPITMRNLGMSWDVVGVILSLVLIPWLFLPGIVGKYADKTCGEKEMIIVALFIMTISTGSVFFITTTNPIVWGGVLFFTRVGASMIGTLRDSYFFKRIDGSDVDLIDFYKTSRPAGYIFGAGFTAIILMYLPVQSVFIVMAIFLISALVPAACLKDNKGECEIGKENELRHSWLYNHFH